MIYESVGGSRAYCLETDTSDYDVFRVKNQETKKYSENGTHIIQLSYDEFVRQAVEAPVNPCNPQLLFPHEFLLVNDLSNWIVANREDVVKAMRKDIYAGFLDRAEGLAFGADLYYPSFPKRLVYSTHFAKVLYHYAQGMTFAEAHVCQDDVKELLLAARRKEADKKLLLAVNSEALEQARSVAGFYTGTDNTAILDEFRAVVRAEIERSESA